MAFVNPSLRTRGLWGGDYPRPPSQAVLLWQLTVWKMKQPEEQRRSFLVKEMPQPEIAEAPHTSK